MVYKTKVKEQIGRGIVGLGASAAVVAVQFAVEIPIHMVTGPGPSYLKVWDRAYSKIWTWVKTGK